jgi:hypothetical protein
MSVLKPSDPASVEPSVMVSRAAIHVAMPLRDRALHRPGWATYVEKVPESIALVVGDDVSVRGNAWRIPAATLGMTMRGVTAGFLAVTEADVSRAPGSRQPFASMGVALVNRAAIRMWAPAADIAVTRDDHVAPEPLPVAEILGTRVGHGLVSTTR